MDWIIFFSTYDVISLFLGLTFQLKSTNYLNLIFAEFSDNRATKNISSWKLQIQVHLRCLSKWLSTAVRLEHEATIKIVQAARFIVVTISASFQSRGTERSKSGLFKVFGQTGAGWYKISEQKLWNRCYCIEQLLVGNYCFTGQQNIVSFFLIFWKNLEINP